MVTGGFDESWNRPHQPDDRELWQESDWLTCYDPDSGAGATSRLGRQPNRGKGQPSLFCFIAGAQRFFMKDPGGRGLDCDTSKDDVWADGCRVAGHRVDALGDGRMRYRWDYPETAAALEFADGFFIPRGWDTSGKGADIISWINPDGHLECAGRIRGWMRVGKTQVRIDCLGHRDRSWGYRRNYISMMKNMLGGWGTTGRDFSFATMMLHVKTGDRFVTGFVSRQGVEHDIADIAFYPTMAEDMLSPVAGTILLTLDGGERIRIDGDLAQSFGGYGPGVAFNALGTFTHREQAGFMDFSLCANPWDASSAPASDRVPLAAVQAGLTPSADHQITMVQDDLAIRLQEKSR